MRAQRLLIPVLMLGLASTLAAHDLFLKLADYLVAPNSAIRVTALNGTFTTSENSIDRSRIADVSLVGPTGRERVDTAQVVRVGSRTQIKVRTGAAGTYVLGLSVRPSEITLTGAQFNAYLEEEGLGHIVAARREAGQLNNGATERYAKHVKVIFQAGGARSESYAAVLGYPVEIVPLANPYGLSAGDTLAFKLLVDGAPKAGLEALTGGRTPAGARHRARTLRSDADGVIRVPLSASGTWFVKFISMTHVPGAKPDYVSQWATVTFAVPRRPARKAN
jgi:uncharacterized GH25 family protein